MEGNWSYPVTGTIDDSYTKALFDRYRDESVEWMVTNSRQEVRIYSTFYINTILI